MHIISPRYSKFVRRNNTRRDGVIKCSEAKVRKTPRFHKMGFLFCKTQGVVIVRAGAMNITYKRTCVHCNLARCACAQVCGSGSRQIEWFERWFVEANICTFGIFLFSNMALIRWAPAEFHLISYTQYVFDF